MNRPTWSMLWPATLLMLLACEGQDEAGAAAGGGQTSAGQGGKGGKGGQTSAGQGGGKSGQAGQAGQGGAGGQAGQGGAGGQTPAGQGGAGAQGGQGGQAGAPGKPPVEASSCEVSSVQEALAKAEDGATVAIPAGVCVWKQPLHVEKNRVTLRGAGAGVTEIQSLVDGTFLDIALPTAGAAFRLTGLTLAPAAGVKAENKAAPIFVKGACDAQGCARLRIDHVAFRDWAYFGYGAPQNNFPNYLMRISDVFGVLDHLDAKMAAGGEFANVGFNAYLGVGTYGDASWAAPDDFGTGRSVYIEDSNLETTHDGRWALTDTDNAPAGGGRFVVRHNTLKNFEVQTHGTESTGRTRGGRSFEVYENNFECSYANSCQLVYLRSGTAMIHHNKITTPGGFLSGFVSLAAYRTFANLGGWGWCNGTGPWDDNDGQVYETGTVTASTPTTEAQPGVTDSSKSWKPGQWVAAGAPYSLVDSTQDNFGYEIGSNDATSIGVVNAGQDYWNGPPTWKTGDTYQVLRARACIDQPGRGQGDLLTGETPTPTGWVHEALSPVIEWADLLDGTNFGGWVGSDTARIIADRDYYEQAASFDGAHGTGHGPLAARPATCTPGVAYWSDDDQTLSRCQEGGGWAPYYKPFAYPYPLDAEGYPAP